MFGVIKTRRHTRRQKKKGGGKKRQSDRYDSVPPSSPPLSIKNLLVFWCFEPCQPLKIIISGLKTNCHPSLNYSAHKSLNVNHITITVKTYNGLMDTRVVCLPFCTLPFVSCLLLISAQSWTICHFLLSFFRIQLSCFSIFLVTNFFLVTNVSLELKSLTLWVINFYIQLNWFSFSFVIHFCLESRQFSFSTVSFFVCAVKVLFILLC